MKKVQICQNPPTPLIKSLFTTKQKSKKKIILKDKKMLKPLSILCIRWVVNFHNGELNDDLVPIGTAEVHGLSTLTILDY